MANIPKEMVEALESIENIDMTNFAYALIDTIPPYFWIVGASSTGKYHPAFALGDGGLMRHTCALVKLLNHIFNIESMNNWTSRERDCLRIAAIMHDTRKSGSQEDYKQSKYTIHEHPLLAAKVVRSFLGCGVIEDDEIELIADAIEAHMGQWNTSDRSTVILPTPKNRYQKILHMVDYLASRKDIEIKFPINEENISINTYRLTFGKHSGKTLIEVQECDPSYIDWLKTQDMKPPVNELIKQI